MDPGKSRMEKMEKKLKNDIIDMINYPSPGERKKAAEETINRLQSELQTEINR